MTTDDYFDLHTNIALQLSGGRDSLAVLAELRPYWNRLTVYWLSTGDNFQETIDVLERVRREVPHFVEVKSNVAVEWLEHGFPVDVLPVRNTLRGRIYEGQALQLQSRYTCCERVILRPMHQRMHEDNITLIIRGQRFSDRLKGPLTSGVCADSFQFLYPIEGWSDEQVMARIRKEDWEVPRFYESMSATPDCKGCTAYLHEGKGPYMKKHHPEEYLLWKDRLHLIQAEILNGLAPFYEEMK